MVKKSKPEPDIFLKCENQLGVNPEDTYVIIWFESILDEYNRLQSFGIMNDNFVTE